MAAKLSCDKYSITDLEENSCPILENLQEGLWCVYTGRHRDRGRDVLIAQRRRPM